MSRVFLYYQVYSMYEQNIPFEEIARRIYGEVSKRTVKRVRELIRYASRKIRGKNNFLPCLYRETFPAHSHLVFDPKTSSYVDPETGVVLEEELPFSEVGEEFLSHASPTPASLTSLGTIFFSKRLGRIQSDPPGALGDDKIIRINDGLEELSRVLGLLGVPSDSVVRESASRLLRMNIDYFDDIVEVVVSSVMVSVAAFRPGDIGRVFDIATSYGISSRHLISLVMRMRVPTKLYEKAFYGLLEFLVNSRS